MSSDATNTALAAVLDSLTFVQGQLDAIAKSNAQIERTQAEILLRLDTVDAGQAAVTDLVPILETILGRLIDDREVNRAGFARTAEVAAFAHAAVLGNMASLPTEVADDPLLEQFALRQPADQVSQERAIVEWRETVHDSDTANLTRLLVAQYQPSPTDTPESRVLRYRLAAIARSELASRGAVLPAIPRWTVASDRTVEAQRARSVELARLWRAGASPALFADPELAAAVDLFARSQAENGAVTVDRSGDLAALHRRIGERIEAGERPSFSDSDRGLDLDRELPSQQR